MNREKQNWLQFKPIFVAYTGPDMEGTECVAFKSPTDLIVHGEDELGGKDIIKAIVNDKVVPASNIESLIAIVKESIGK